MKGTNDMDKLALMKGTPDGMFPAPKYMDKLGLMQELDEYHGVNPPRRTDQASLRLLVMQCRTEYMQQPLPTRPQEIIFAINALGRQLPPEQTWSVLQLQYMLKELMDKQRLILLPPSTRMDFGKYKEKYVYRQMMQVDPVYCRWCIKAKREHGEKCSRQLNSFALFLMALEEEEERARSMALAEKMERAVSLQDLPRRDKIEAMDHSWRRAKSMDHCPTSQWCGVPKRIRSNSKSNHLAEW